MSIKTFLDMPVKELFHQKKKPRHNTKADDASIGMLGWNASATNIIEMVGGAGELFGLIFCIGIIVLATIISWWLGILMFAAIFGLYIQKRNE